MATYDELRDETGAAAGMWNAEKQSLSMKALCARLRTFYGVPFGNIGSKGDNAPGHMRGAHRSRNWILNSIYCTNRTYTVTETPGNRNGGDPDWLAGIDMTIPRDPLLAACQRLDVAVRAGRLEKVTEWYGNKDGDLRVDGYDNIRDQVATSDSSHLWHLHLTFDRGRAGEDHNDVYAVLTGTGTTKKRGNAMLVRSGAGDGSIYFVPGGLTAKGKAAGYAVYPPLLDALAASGMPYLQLPAGMSVPAAGLFDLAPGPLVVDAELSDADIAAVAAAAKAGAEQGSVAAADEIADAVVDEQHARLAE